MFGQFRGEVELLRFARRVERVGLDSGSHPKLMNATVARSVRIKLETNLADRTELFLENRHHILLSEPMRDQLEFRV